MSDVIKYDDEYSLLIDGFVREISLQFEVYIPTEIVSVIYDLYPKSDKWDQSLMNDKIMIDTESNSITRISTGGGWENSYGKYRITPNKYNPSKLIKREGYQIIHAWKIKLVSAYHLRINIGIAVESNLDSIAENVAFNYRNKGYGIYPCLVHAYGVNARGDAYKLKFAQGDIVEIILLFKHGKYGQCCLGYTANDSCIEIIFDDVNIDETYLVGVALNEKDDCVQLIE